MQRFEDVQAIGGNRLGGGKFVAVTHFGFQHFVSGGFGGNIDPEFVRLGEGGDGEEGGD